MQLSATKVWKFPKNKYNKNLDVTLRNVLCNPYSDSLMPEKQHIGGLSANQASWHHVSCRSCISQHSVHCTACATASCLTVPRLCSCTSTHLPPGGRTTASAAIRPVCTKYTPLHSIVACQRQAWQLCYMPCCIAAPSFFFLDSTKHAPAGIHVSSMHLRPWTLLHTCLRRNRLGNDPSRTPVTSTSTGPHDA